MPSVAVGGYGCRARMVGSEAKVLWVSSSDEVPEEVLSDTSRRRVAVLPAICLSV